MLLFLCFVVASDCKTTNRIPTNILEENVLDVVLDVLDEKTCRFLVPKMIWVQHIFTRG
jgi:hypothetical protein